jgi:RNA polymerase sigma factor (sigma-70 family)
MNSQTQILEFCKFQCDLYRFAFSLTRDEHNAHDLVQDTLLAATRFVAKFQEGTSAKSWLFRILKNFFINKYRKAKKLPYHVDFEDAQRSISNIEQISQNWEIGDVVTIAINKLGDDFKQIINLCDIDGFSYQEISDILEIPIGTVRSRIFRARNFLKESLASYAKELGYKTCR